MIDDLPRERIQQQISGQVGRAARMDRSHGDSSLLPREAQCFVAVLGWADSVYIRTTLVVGLSHRRSSNLPLKVATIIRHPGFVLCFAPRHRVSTVTSTCFRVVSAW